MQKKRSLIILGIVVVVVLVLAALFWKSPSSSTPEPATQGNIPAITTLSLSDALRESMSDSKPTVVEVSGKIVNKISLLDSDANPAQQLYFLEITDGSSSALLDLRSFPQLYPKFSVGDTVVARGALGAFACDSTTMTTASTKKLCGSVKTTQTRLPIVILMPNLMQLYGNQEPLESK